MTTNPDVLRLARELAAQDAESHGAHELAAMLRKEGGDCISIRVAIAAIERTTELAKRLAFTGTDAAGRVNKSDIHRGYAGGRLQVSKELENYDHLRQPEKGSTDAE